MKSTPTARQAADTDASLQNASSKLCHIVWFSSTKLLPYLGHAERQIAPLLELLRGVEPRAQLVHEAVCVLLLANVLQQVAHDLLEALLRQVRLAAEVGQDLWQQVVHRRGSLWRSLSQQTVSLCRFIPVNAAVNDSSPDPQNI